MFVSYHIEAVTVGTRGTADTGQIAKAGHAAQSSPLATNKASPPTKIAGVQKFGLEKAGGIVEGVFRALNGIHQRFNLSFHLYFMAGDARFVSIARYFPCFALFTAGLLITAIALWWEAGQRSSPPGTATDTVVPPFTFPPRNVFPALLTACLAYLAGALWLVLGIVIAPALPTAYALSIPGVCATQGDLSAAIAFTVGGLLAAFTFRGLCWLIVGKSAVDGCLVRCFTLLASALLLHTWGIANIGLAAVFSTLYLPFLLGLPWRNPRSRALTVLLDAGLVAAWSAVLESAGPTQLDACGLLARALEDFHAVGALSLPTLVVAVVPSLALLHSFR
jgi:hypothetical protein